MRGKDQSDHRLDRSGGITPAYAGKSSLDHQSHQNFRDHPRLCGEKAAAWRKIKMEVGSPPPMRGKVILNEMQLNGARITPAYAGKSFLSTSRAFCN